MQNEQEIFLRMPGPEDLQPGAIIALPAITPTQYAALLQRFEIRLSRAFNQELGSFRVAILVKRREFVPAPKLDRIVAEQQADGTWLLILPDGEIREKIQTREECQHYANIWVTTDAMIRGVDVVYGGIEFRPLQGRTEDVDPT
jgi:hypothetical protein